MTVGSVGQVRYRRTPAQCSSPRKKTRCPSAAGVQSRPGDALQTFCPSRSPRPGWLVSFSWVGYLSMNVTRPTSYLVNLSRCSSPVPLFESRPTVRVPSHRSSPVPPFESRPTVRVPSHRSSPVPPFESRPTVRVPTHRSCPDPPLVSRPTARVPTHRSCPDPRFVSRPTVRVPTHGSCPDPPFESRPTVRVPSHRSCPVPLRHLRWRCRGRFSPIEKRIPITAGDPNFVPAGDVVPTGKSLTATLDLGFGHGGRAGYSRCETRHSRPRTDRPMTASERRPSFILRPKMQLAKTEFLRAHKQLQEFFARLSGKGHFAGG